MVSIGGKTNSTTTVRRGLLRVPFLVALLVLAISLNTGVGPLAATGGSKSTSSPPTSSSSASQGTAADSTTTTADIADSTASATKGPNEVVIINAPNAIIKTSSGNDWELWSTYLSATTTPIVKLDNLTCNWVEFRSTVPGATSPMCVHNQRDFVSTSIMKKGRWGDCDKLTALWHENYQPNSIYAEIGANIGSCVMQMLLTTNATILAFEPHPRNQFCLTSTLVAMERKYSDRVFLFPIALGLEGGNSTINAAEGNMGNSVVSKQVGDFKNQQFTLPIPIRIERLDDLVDMSSSTVSLMKLDAQGFECYIIDGMKSLLKKTMAIKTEVANRWLRSFPGCSSKIMLNKLRGNGFEIYSGDAILNANKPLGKGGIFDIVAKKTV